MNVMEISLLLLLLCCSVVVWVLLSEPLQMCAKMSSGVQVISVEHCAVLVSLGPQQLRKRLDPGWKDDLPLGTWRSQHPLCLEKGTGALFLL